jgi:small subunit ribosomal protein S4
MTKRLTAKYKADRRYGQNLWGRPKSPVNKRSYGPGQHGQRRKGKTSDFGQQLAAKQKLRLIYGNITEKQFRRIFAEASRRKGNTAENLIGLLESRLDSVIYRAKFTPTPFAARQFVNHGHVKVNGRRVTIPSFVCRAGDTIEVSDKAKAMALVLEALGSGERDVPDYIDVDPKGMTAKYVRVPLLAEVPYAVQMEPNLVVEYYAS